MVNTRVKEFVIGSDNVHLVKDLIERIRLLFSVNVIFQLVSGDKSQWIRLTGGTEEEQEKAKEYIMSACEEIIHREISLSSDIYNELSKEDDHKNLERISCAVVKFRSDNLTVLLRGSEIAVTIAQSKIEEKISQLKTNDINSAVTGDQSLEAGDAQVNKSSELKTEDLETGILRSTPSSALQDLEIVGDETEVKLDPSLKEFAMKLDYTEEEIDLVVRKFGPKVNQDKLLHELIRYSSGKKIGRGTEPDAIQLQAGRYSPQVVARGCPSIMRMNPKLNRGQPEVDPQSDPNSKDDTYDSCMFFKGVEDDLDPLRHIVIDGSNVAMHHGGQDYFSCRGIQLCVDYFKHKGHKEITVFVPRWRMEAPRPETPITDQEILRSLEREKHLAWTPSRRGTNGRRIVCYDDRFVLDLALQKNGIVVSNDNYRDLLKENSKWKDVIEQRLLMYSFVGDIFMVPDDPLGRHGPSLDDFLRKGTATHPKVCPFLKNCTFGLRCRYYHPERDPNRVNRSVGSRGPRGKDSDPEHQGRTHEVDPENLRCRSAITDAVPAPRTVLVADSSTNVSPTFQGQMERRSHSDVVRRGPLPTLTNQLSPDEYLQIYPEGPHHQYRQTLPGYRDNVMTVNSNSSNQYYGYDQAQVGHNGVYYPGNHSNYPNMPSYYHVPPQQWSGYYMCPPPMYSSLYSPSDQLEEKDSPIDSLFKKLREIFPDREQIIKDVMRSNPEKCFNNDLQHLVESILSETNTK